MEWSMMVVIVGVVVIVLVALGLFALVKTMGR